MTAAAVVAVAVVPEDEDALSLKDGEEAEHVGDVGGDANVPIAVTAATAVIVVAARVAPVAPAAPPCFFSSTP